MATAQQIASPGVYVTDDVGVEITDGQNSRAQLGLLPTGNYGLRVVTAGGSAVIIDGTSDMFKIAASGTLSMTAPDGTVDGFTSVTLSALGTYSNVPMVLFQTGIQPSSMTSNRYAGQTRNAFDAWLSLTSGGATTTHVAATNSSLNAIARLDADPTGSVLIGLFVTNLNGSSYTAGIRYYVLQEAGV